MTYYDEALQELQQKKAEKIRLEAKERTLKRQEAALAEELQELEKIKIREEADVDRLQRRSLANFYYQVIGKKEGMLTKEKEEAYAAAVKYDAALHSWERARADLADIAQKLKPLQKCDQQYEEMLAAKREWLLALNDPAAQEIVELEMLCTQLKGQKKEIDEAVQAGERALSIIQSVIDSLNSAKNWGTWDALGGGLISDIAKHTHLDEAQYKIELLQDALRRFQTELADIKLQAEMQVQIDGFLRFADFFFDGLFADLTVLERIRNSQEQVYRIRKQLEDALKRLRDMRDASEQKEFTAKIKCEALIRTAEGLPAADEDY